MPDATTLRRITAYVIGASAILAGLALALGGLAMGLAAVVGGAFAVGNWLVMRWLGHRLLVSNERGRAMWGLLLAVKMGVSMALVWAILSTGVIDPIGFVIGLGGLVLGIVAGAFHTMLAAPAPRAEET
ncbi:MAG: hypothetical protein KF729_21865 [Sandaracinaceae bacterium]|nr:hypothetical protein [Sandaracinaceae bacterium]